jgi:hypothetical protein
LWRSISVTDTRSRASLAAQAMPPKPAPTITTRGKPSSANAGFPPSCGKRARSQCSLNPSSDKAPAPVVASSASTENHDV